MIYLALCILMNVWIYVDFRLFHIYRVNAFQAIIINYFVCIATGLLTIRDFNALSNINYNFTWVAIAIALGVVFIVNFNVISLTTRNLGISVASVATKTSLIIPILVSLLILPVQFKTFNLFNYLGIFLSIPAVVLSSWKKREVKKTKAAHHWLALPALTFLLSGAIDGSVNFVNYYFLDASTEKIFPIIIFSCAGLLGSAYLIISKSKIEWKNVVGGIALGIPNYLALYFMLRSLSHFKNDGALVYSTVNIGVILLAAAFSMLFFRERLSIVNTVGIFLSLAAILLIFYQEASAWIY